MSFPGKTNLLGGSVDDDSGSLPSNNVFGAREARAAEPMEERPAMRSVGMVTAPTLLQDPFSGGKLGLSKPPPLGLARPSAGLRKKSYECPGFMGVKQEWTGTVLPSFWDVKAEDLEMVPLDFPLERTHRLIHGSSASDVASRVSEALRSLSIDAQYDSKNAKAKCKTGDLVSFRIRLFSGGENGQPVVVEIQRRSGSAPSFMCSCRAILNAAEGLEVDKNLLLPKPTPTMNQPVSLMKCLSMVYQNGQNADVDSEAALSNSMEMIRSGRRDTVVLGLENLIALTDPVKTSPPIAVRISKFVVIGHSIHDFREEMRALTERDLFSVGGEDEELPTQHLEQVRHLSLNVVSNALETCVADHSLEPSLQSDKWFADYLVPLLVDEVKRASTNACMACTAASCLGSLLYCSSVTHKMVISNGGIEALEAAKELGEVRHALLASETRRCLNVLKTSAVA